jgi:hypothetical protein
VDLNSVFLKVRASGVRDDEPASGRTTTEGIH